MTETKGLKNKKILLLGGAFDPPHFGHYIAACRALALNSEKGFKELWFMPYYSDPFTNKDVSDGKHREEMLRCMLKSWGFSGMSVCTYELESRNTDGTYAAVSMLQKFYRNAEFMYVIGQDQHELLPTWRNYDKLKDIIDFFILPRWGDVSSTKIRKFFSCLNKETRMSDRWFETWLASRVEKYIIEKDLYMKE